MQDHRPSTLGLPGSKRGLPVTRGSAKNDPRLYRRFDFSIGAAFACFLLLGAWDCRMRPADLLEQICFMYVVLVFGFDANLMLCVRKH